ncbi:uncharacterized protein [Antedon mediterranea]|uniref:uncharacterized protein n=1 Tax=Antedon mediterranea TaxID=105859 RepID=UPI003AF8D9C6
MSIGTNMELHRLIAERSVSEHSAEMSLSSLSLNITSDESMKSSDSPVDVAVEFPSFPKNIGNKLPLNIPIEKRKKMNVLDIVFEFPDSITWSSPTKTVVVEKSENGKLGIAFYQKQGSCRYYFTIHSIKRDSPVYGKLKCGDWILSVNGNPMDSEKNVSKLSSIVKNTRNVKFIVQSPKKYDASKLYLGGTNPLNPQRQKKVVNKESWLDTNMPNLPFLKLFVFGKESSSITLSLIGATSMSEVKPTNPVAALAYADLNQDHDWLRVKHSVNYFAEVLDSRQNFAFRGQSFGGTFHQNVRLEVVALKEGHLTESCSQILLCKHAIYAIQFSVEQFLADSESVLETIQKHLCKIKCYVSTKVRVYLIGTQNSNISCNVHDIGRTLHNRFCVSYGNMLQYDALTNAPCFIVKLTRYNQRKLISESFDSFSDNNMLLEMYDDHFGEDFHLYDMQVVKNHISKVALRQGFVDASYPYRYLQLHKRVHDLRDQGLKFQLQNNFILNCMDVNSCLTYLHDSGDILNTGNLVFSSSTPNGLIMLDRQHLLRNACTISNAPLESLCHPNYYDGWQNLKTSACAEKKFLSQLVDGVHKVELLESMNVIHCLKRNDVCGANNNHSDDVYLVPIYLKQHFELDPFLKRQFHHQLCVDFNGIIPDGLFLRSAILMIQKLQQSDWQFLSHNALQVSMRGCCEFIIESDSRKGVINIHATWFGTYSPLNLLNLVTEVFTAISPQRTLIGPPCPLSCDECHKRDGDNRQTHVIDLSKYSMYNGLYCGSEHIDNDEHVAPWIQKKPANVICQIPDSTMKCLSLKTRLMDLPTKVTNIIEDNMNYDDPLNRNWKGLASILGYTCRKAKMLENYPNKTGKLLQDFAKQGGVTLGKMFNLLKHEELRRFDIIEDIESCFEIVD